MNSCLSDLLEGDRFGPVSVQGSPQDPHQQNQQQATYERAQRNMMSAGQLTSFGLNCAHAAKTLLSVFL